MHSDMKLIPEPTLPEIDPPLIDVLPDPAPELNVQPEPSRQRPATSATDLASGNQAETAAPSLFQSLDEDSSDSGDDADPNLNKESEKWAQLMLELDALRTTAGGAKKGKKGKSSGVVLETPEMRRLKEKIAKVEKEYMFSRKDAGEYWYVA